MSALNTENTDWLSELLSLACEDPTPEELAAEQKAAAGNLQCADPLWSALCFSSLLMNPVYQPNCLRLESLIHLCTAVGFGRDFASPETLASAFEELGNGRIGLMEDPIEDVFVNNVVFGGQNYRVAEGSWESGAFYLQRFLEVLETCPDDDYFDDLRANVRSLLVVSEEAFRRFGVQRYSVGREFPNATCSPEEFQSAAARKLVFSDGDIDQLGVALRDLSPFILADEYRNEIGRHRIGQSPMHQQPLVRIDQGTAFLLPTATTYALRMYLIRRLIEGGYRAQLMQSLALVYQQHFQGTPEFGLPQRSPLLFSASGEGGVIQEFDKGRYLHMVFVLDDLTDIKATGVGGVNQGLLRCSESVRSQILKAKTCVSRKSGFRSGLTLVVTCGVGRGGTLAIPAMGEKWHVESITAPDLTTLGWTRGTDVQKLFTAIFAFNRLKETPLKLLNVNGLLNLVSWMQSNDWQVVPHARLPKQLRKKGGILQVPTNALLTLRSNTAQRTDRVGIRHPSRGLVVCRRLNESHFSTDDRLPLYSPEFVEQGSPVPFIYRSGECDWWCFATCKNSRLSYDRWATLKTWIPRISPVVEAELREIPAAIEVCVSFEGPQSEMPAATLPGVGAVRSDIRIRSRNRAAVEIMVGSTFELAIQADTNIAETALVAAICSAVGLVGGKKLSNREELEMADAIIPCDQARHLHGFQARRFRDFVSSCLRGSVVQIDEIDSAALRIGLAFRAESRQRGRYATKKKHRSTHLLNAVVVSLEDELAGRLQRLDRKELVILALLNHERAMYSRNRWMRTAAANLALRGGTSEVSATIKQRDAELSSTVSLSQAIAETAVSDGALEKGDSVGEYDLRELMSLVNAIVQLAGWSAAIHLEAMAPGLTITALGDIQADQTFQNDIVVPFGDVQAQDHLDTAVQEYEENFAPPSVADDAPRLEAQFESAWTTEIGASLDSIRVFIDIVEDLGIERNDPVYPIQRSKLVGVCNERGCPDVEAILDAFVLVPRAGWRCVPESCKGEDVQLWRYRRQLSAVRRPILQIDNSTDPELVVAPGFVRDCVAYTVSGYYEGNYPSRHYRSAEMRRWHDVRRDQRGAGFAAAVADACRAAGWECREEMYVKTLIQCTRHPVLGDTRRYGEVDVVAWDVEKRRLLFIECKHLYHGKTAGEIAEQLSDYRGEVWTNGSKTKRDELRKHLDRIEVLKDHRDTVLKTLGLESDYCMEGWVVFRNPVPMLHKWKQFTGRVSFAAFRDFDRVLNGSVDEN